VCRIFQEHLSTLQELQLAVAAVVTEVADDLAVMKQKGIATSSSASPQRSILPALGRLKRNALTTPKDVINALGFPVETTPEDVSDVTCLLQ